MCLICSPTLVKNTNVVILAEEKLLSCGVAVLPSSLDNMLSVATALSRPLLEHLHCLVVTLGAYGVLVCGEHDAGSVNMKPRKQKKARTVLIHTSGMMNIITIQCDVHCGCFCRRGSFVLYTTQR